MLNYTAAFSDGRVRERRKGERMEIKMRVVRGMVIRCEFGSIDNYINTDRGHGVLFNENPVLNANDILQGIHIIGFGDCSSNQYILENVNRIMMVGSSDTLLENITKCFPKIEKPWINCNERTILEGAPSLIVGSCCSCKHGGTIEILELTE